MKTKMSLFSPFLTIAKHNRLLRGAVRSEISQRYAGSIAGLAWAIIYPTVLFCIYSVLYLVIFRVRPMEMTSSAYVIYIMGGLLPFLGFAEALTTGTTSLSSKKTLLLNTVYPSEFIPLQAVISSHITTFVGVFLLIIAELILLRHIPWTVILVPFLIILQIMFTCGIVWVLSILNLVIKDIQQALSFVTILLMIISPIAYTPSMVPRALKLMIWLNPFSFYVRAYQDIFVYGTVTSNFFIATAISFVFFIAGYSFYNRTKKVFYEFA